MHDVTVQGPTPKHADRLVSLHGGWMEGETALEASKVGAGGRWAKVLKRKAVLGAVGGG